MMPFMLFINGCFDQRLILGILIFLDIFSWFVASNNMIGLNSYVFYLFTDSLIANKIAIIQTQQAKVTSRK